jgi:hypothetical protein
MSAAIQMRPRLVLCQLGVHWATTWFFSMVASSLLVPLKPLLRLRQDMGEGAVLTLHAEGVRLGFSQNLSKKEAADQCHSSTAHLTDGRQQASHGSLGLACC